MTTTETQYGREARTADSRFFIAPENRPGQLILDLVAHLPAIAADSTEAKQKLQELTEDDYKEYQDNLSRLTGPDRDEASRIVGRIQGLLEASNRYSDATAAIHKAGQSLATHIRDTMPVGMQMINGNPYWVAADSQGRRQLCGTDETGEAFIVFGTLADERKEVGDVARLPDYIQLIGDVEAEMTPQSHS